MGIKANALICSRAAPPAGLGLAPSPTEGGALGFAQRASVPSRVRPASLADTFPIYRRRDIDASDAPIYDIHTSITTRINMMDLARERMKASI